MSEVRVWHFSFRYYKELVGIECDSYKGVERLIKALGAGDLRTCPYEITANTFVAPKEAIRFMPLGGIKHRIVELRQTVSLSTEVNEELMRRFRARTRGETKEPHYYTCGSGVHRTCVKHLVPLATVQAIETELSEKVR